MFTRYDPRLTSSTLVFLYLTSVARCAESVDYVKFISGPFAENPHHFSAVIRSLITPHNHTKHPMVWWSILPLLVGIGIFQFYRRKRTLAKGTDANRRQRSGSSVHGAQPKGMLHSSKAPNPAGKDPRGVRKSLIDDYTAFGNALVSMASCNQTEHLCLQLLFTYFSL